MSIDETTDIAAINTLLAIFAITAGVEAPQISDVPNACTLPKELKRQTSYLTHEVFCRYHTETE